MDICPDPDRKPGRRENVASVSIADAISGGTLVSWWLDQHCGGILEKRPWAKVPTVDFPRTMFSGSALHVDADSAVELRVLTSSRSAGYAVILTLAVYTQQDLDSLSLMWTDTYKEGS